MVFEDIVTAVKAQGGLDVSDVMAGGWVNEVYRTAVVKAKWLMASVSLGNTVAGTATYAIPDRVAEIDGLYLDGADGPVDYRRVGTTDLWNLKAGRARLDGSGGVFAPQFSAVTPSEDEGHKLVELFPAPVESGVGISTLASVIPDALIPGVSPLIPEDMHGDLLDGAISLGLARIDERLDSAAVYAQKFAAMVQELSRRKNRRVSGEPQRLAIWGSDWR